MKIENHEGFDVIGLSGRVQNDQPSGIMALWTAFHQSALRERLTDVLGNDFYCVYHDYVGDHSQPYFMTIGYRVSAGAACPEGLCRVTLPAQTIAIFETIGEQPKALISQWQAIWQSDLDRTYSADFDTYHAESLTTVTISIGVKPA